MTDTNEIEFCEEWLSLKKSHFKIIAVATVLADNKRAFRGSLNDLCAEIGVNPSSVNKRNIKTINNMLIELYATMAQAEIEKKEKRQQEGIQAKKARGEWEDYGRPRAVKPSNWDEVIAQWKNGEITAVKAMELTETKKTTFYKLLKS